CGADGVTLDRDAFDVRPGSGVTAVTVSEHVATAMLRTEAVAAAGAHELLSIGVTWSDEAEWEGSVLLESLIESGIDNVVAVGLAEATEALARGIGRIVEYEKTAVCVIEPGAVMALEVDGRADAVQTVVNHRLTTEAELVRWLTMILDSADWQPDGLVVVGSGGDIDAITGRLQRELPVPVIAPAEAELALARGAALASAHDVEFADRDLRRQPAGGERRRRMPLPYLGALTLLVAAALTFVVSVSLAVGLKLTSDSNAKPAEHQQVVHTSGPPAMIQAAAPPAPPPMAQLVPPPAADPPAPMPDAAPIVDVPESPPVQSAPEEPAAGVPPPTDVPAAAPPPPLPASTPPVPPSSTGTGGLRDHSPLLTKILEHVPGLHRSPAEQQEPTTDQVPPPAPPPPADVPAPPAG
ncbi:MAG: hypothetical protein QOE41_2732, partial [Mycobacterium sp.]|nr:hypothetical protein [Mycobacterium sp.]